MGNRASDFRYLFANAFGVAISDNDCRVIFGIEEGGGPDEMHEQLAVAMTLKTAKMLAAHLSKIIVHIEKASGTEIPLDLEKIAKLEEVLEATTPLVANASEPQT